ncbi:MAG: AIR synthase related protein [Thermomicrobiales bacterium]
MDTPLPLGKLPNALLGRLLARYATPDPRLIIGPGVGHDAAAIALDDARALVVKSDPITFATAEIGWYLVNVNANDLACLGATPRWLLVTALLPEGRTTPATVEAIFAGLHDACAPLNIALVGGHTEITHGLDRPILVGTLLGEADRASLVKPGAAQEGDIILLTSGIAVEGTAIIASERADEVTRRHGADFATRCRNFLRDPASASSAPPPSPASTARPRSTTPPKGASRPACANSPPPPTSASPSTPPACRSIPKPPPSAPTTASTPSA